VRKNVKALKAVFLFLLITCTLSCQIYNLVPSRVIIGEGEDFRLPPLISAAEGAKGTQLKLFGFLPFKTVEVNVLQKTKLIPCGSCVGIKININGAMVIELSSIQGIDGKKYSPASSAGMKKGDIITKIDDKQITKISDLKECIENSGGRELTFEVKRQNGVKYLKIKPILSNDDNMYKIAAWVRDGTSGIGTVTYIDPKDNTFGALGHGITDIDTGKIMPAGEGTILSSSITGINKGKRGSPGELKGVFNASSKMGVVTENNDNGVFGTLWEKPNLQMRPMEVAVRSQIMRGEAYILSNIEGKAVKKYKINIESIMKNSAGNKGMIIKITDEELLEKTGGIVQGMSGCPIIQNNRIIGAITHVFINDPARGYATFIDVMINSNI
jgi:stage IV sporulation protein B